MGTESIDLSRFRRFGNVKFYMQLVRSPSGTACPANLPRKK